MSPNYYVYYRVALDQSERARGVVAALQDEVLAQTGVRGRLMHRRDDPATWMEIYEGVADGHAFDAALANAVKRSAFASVLAAGSRRITEIFGPL